MTEHPLLVHPETGEQLEMELDIWVACGGDLEKLLAEAGAAGDHELADAIIEYEGPSR